MNAPAKFIREETRLDRILSLAAQLKSEAADFQASTFSPSMREQCQEIMNAIDDAVLSREWWEAKIRGE